MTKLASCTPYSVDIVRKKVAQKKNQSKISISQTIS